MSKGTDWNYIVKLEKAIEQKYGKILTLTGMKKKKRNILSN